MPYEPNDQNYQTKNSRISSFDDFNSNIGKEKDELKKINRSIVHNNDVDHQVPKNTKYKFNRVTRKMDDISKSEIEDDIESIDIDEPKHKWKATVPEQQGRNESNVIKGTFEDDENDDAWTVADLIEELSTCDPNSKVYYTLGGSSNYGPVNYIEDDSYEIDEDERPGVLIGELTW